MSRSGYVEDLDTWDLIRWRGAVCRAITGERGQRVLQEMAEALDAMPEKRLIRATLESEGEVCALGCIGRKRGMEMSGLDAEDPEAVAKAFGTATALAREIASINDDSYCETPEERWQFVRRWVARQIKASA